MHITDDIVQETIHLAHNEDGARSAPPDAAASPTRPWSEQAPITGAGYERVDCRVACVLTRFRLRHAWSLPFFYLAFRRVRRESTRVHGLLQALFLVENLRTCYTLSLWQDDRAIIDFSTHVRAHIHAANSAFGPTFRHDRRRPEIFSVQWRLRGVSHNLNWGDFDLRQVIAEQTGRRAEDIAGDVHMTAPSGGEDS